MVFISMVVASIVVIVLIVGLLALIAGIGMLIGRAFSSKKKKSKALLVFGIILTVIGCIMFVLPTVIYCVGQINKKIDLAREHREYPDNISVPSDWHYGEGFRYNDVVYVPADYLVNLTEQDDMDKVVAFIEPDGEYVGFCEVINEAGVAMLVSDQGKIFIPGDEYDAVKDYYMNQSPVTYEIIVDGETVTIDFDREVFGRLDSLFDEDTDFSCSSNEVGNTIYIYEVSTDGFYKNHISVATAGDRIVLTHTLSGGVMNGHLMSSEDEAYVREKISSYF